MNPDVDSREEEGGGAGGGPEGGGKRRRGTGKAEALARVPEMPRNSFWIAVPLIGVFKRHPKLPSVAPNE